MIKRRSSAARSATRGIAPKSLHDLKEEMRGDVDFANCCCRLQELKVDNAGARWASGSIDHDGSGGSILMFDMESCAKASSRGFLIPM